MWMWFLKTSHLRSLGELTVNNLIFFFASKDASHSTQGTLWLRYVCIRCLMGWGDFTVFLILHEGVIIPPGGNAHF